MEWLMEDTPTAEHLNTLILMDKSFENKGLQVRPTFHILGGSALLFHGIESVVTIDIDVANRLTEEVREVVEPFISDSASEVATLPKNYRLRLHPFHEEEFKNINVYLLSVEDLVITKLGAGRTKDMDDIRRTDILKRCDIDKVMKIMREELPQEQATKLLIALDSVL